MPGKCPPPNPRSNSAETVAIFSSFDGGMTLSSLVSASFVHDRAYKNSGIQARVQQENDRRLWPGGRILFSLCNSETVDHDFMHFGNDVKTKIEFRKWRG